jgi:hypothetical protein
LDGDGSSYIVVHASVLVRDHTAITIILILACIFWELAAINDRMKPHE